MCGTGSSLESSKFFSGHKNFQMLLLISDQIGFLGRVFLWRINFCAVVDCCCNLSIGRWELLAWKVSLSCRAKHTRTSPCYNLCFLSNLRSETPSRPQQSSSLQQRVRTVEHTKCTGLTSLKQISLIW